MPMACMGLGQVESQCWEGKWTKAPTPAQKLSPGNNLLQMKNYFLQQSLTYVQIFLKGRGQAQQ